jgi:acyl carrier protein
MTIDECERHVLAYLRETLVRGGQVGPETQLLSSGLLDSMALTHLVEFVEETFSVAIPDELLGPDAFRTPHSLAELIHRLRTGTAG